jgi:hypothetical protein
MLSSDHANLAKFHGTGDVNYLKVVEAIQKLLFGAVLLVNKNWDKHKQSKGDIIFLRHQLQQA